VTTPTLPDNPQLLDRLIDAINTLFAAHDAQLYDRIDTLAVLAGQTLAACAEADAALEEFTRLVRGYRDQFTLLTRAPEGQA
jgi:hypothetical protein